VGDVTQLEEEVLHVNGYESFWSFSKKKKGYSGVATYVKEGYTLDAVAGIGIPR
jgi:exonuclease III